MIPAGFESFELLKLGPRYDVFSQQDLKVAESLRENTPTKAIVDATPLHNSPVVIAGRRLFLGYDGTLFSHGIDYSERTRMTKSLQRLLLCSDKAESSGSSPALCPQFIFRPQRYLDWQVALKSNQIKRVQGDLYLIQK
jgi:hypothetical protein